MKLSKLFPKDLLLPSVLIGSMLFFAAQTLWAQETKEKVTVDDVERAFMVRLPKGYDSRQHYPVVILLHGMNQDPDDIERLSRFDELADKDGIIAVYPFAMHGRWNVGVQPQERQSMPMSPGRHRRYGGYPGGGAADTPEEVEVIPVAEDSRLQIARLAMRRGRPRSMTLDSSIRCWITWRRTFR